MEKQQRYLALTLEGFSTKIKANLISICKINFKMHNKALKIIVMHGITHPYGNTLHYRSVFGSMYWAKKGLKMS